MLTFFKKLRHTARRSHPEAQVAERSVDVRSRTEENELVETAPGEAAVLKPTRSVFFSIPIPLTSREAYELLCEDGIERVESVVSHFLNLHHCRHSRLISQNQSDKEVNNKEFRQQLKKTASRLFTAIEEKEPYPYLYGDVVKLQEQLQVIQHYYKEQMAQGQPVAKLTEKSLGGKHKLNELNKTPLSESGTKWLAKYTINQCADAIMRKDLTIIKEFIKTPFLLQHEAGFNYLSAS